VFAATVYCTAPLPVPGLPLPMVIQGAWLTAAHPHPACAATVIVPLPPAAANEADVGLNEYVQVDPTPTCEIVTSRPATVIVPVRGLDETVAATT
jgi:hypothetical protein